MYIVYIIIVILLICLAYYFFSSYSQTVYFKSDIDNKVYMIRNGYNKSPEFLRDSANTLALINKRVMLLVSTLENKYKNDHSKNYFIKKLRENYNPYIISEAAVDNRYTSYTVDKQDMHLCLRTRDSQEKIYDINILMYTVLHELSHLCNFNPQGYPIDGHGQEFREIFTLLVNEAVSIGIYRYQDYSKEPVEFCGITINSSIT